MGGSGKPKGDKPKYELYDDIAMRMDWERKRRTTLGRKELDDLYRWLRGGKAPPTPYTSGDLRAWLVELAYLIDDDSRERPDINTDRYESIDAQLTAAHAALVRDMVCDVAEERVAAVEEYLDPETTPEWFNAE